MRKYTKKIISSLNSSVESIKIELDETEDLISDAKEDLHNTEVGIETKKVEMHSLQNNIELNNNELEQLTGNIENLKVRSDKPDLKLSELENILSEHLKIQNILDRLKQGAQPTETVRNLFIKAKVFEQL